MKSRLVKDAEQKGAVERRLKRIAGQVAGIQRMVAEDRYCIEILVQLAAVRSALSKTAQVILSGHIDTCVAESFEQGTTKERHEKLEELFDVFGRFGKL
jgi:DNA-binding FrmR family transcriptional regulator